MAMDLTKEQLSQHVREVVAKVVAEGGLAKEIREVVEASVAKGLEPVHRQQTDWMAKIMAGPALDADTRKAERGNTLARYVRAVGLAKARGVPTAEGAIAILRGWGNDELAKVWEEDLARRKALGASDAAAGGFLVPTQFSQDVIELLRAAGIVRSLGPVTLPMPTGKIQIPKITAGATATYIGENVNITKTEPTFGQVTLTFKKLAALVPISNDLLRYSSPGADSIVRDDLVREMAAREDKAFIRDDGTSATPKGIRNWIDAANKFNANGTVNLDNVTNDLGQAIQKLMSANVPLIIQQGTAQQIDVRPGWMFSPRTYRYLTTVRLTQGPYAFRDEMLTGRLWGFPYRVTSQILETMTAAFADTGGTQSEVYFGGFAYAVIGESQNLLVDASQEAAYDDAGTVRAAFSLDQMVIRVIAEHDFALRQDKGFALIRQVTWGV